MNKRILAAVIVIILLFAAGIIAVTQESEIFVDILDEEQELAQDYDDEENFHEDMLSQELFDEELLEDDFLLNELFSELEEVPPYRGYIYARDIPDWIRPVRWFRSNAGGLAIQESASRLAALRNEYAVSIDFAEREELPDELLPFFNDDKDYIEVRKLYEKGIQIRTQWIFRNLEGKVRLVAVFTEQEDKTGFIEVYNEEGLLSVEYNFYEEGQQTRTDFEFKNGLMISAGVHILEFVNEREQFVLAYIDSFQYNRSEFLRAVERKFYKDSEISFDDEPARFSLPSKIRDAINDKAFLGARYNTMPDFFGVITVAKDFRMVFTTDERNRIVSQTLYNSDDEVVFVITNTWSGDRIASSKKEEGDIVLAVLYEYDSKGNRTREVNTKNGITERIVRTEGQMEIEELYIDNAVVLRAYWEDGRKISETRIRNN